MPILYECYPIEDLQVIPATNIINRACLAPCFLDGISQYHTIPHRFQSSAQRLFDGGKADKAKPCGEGSKLYELNIWAMRLGGPRERTVAVAESLLPRQRKQRGIHKEAQDR